MRSASSGDGGVLGVVGRLPPYGASATSRGLRSVGPSAGDIISEGVLAIEMGADAVDVGLTVHPHPTMSEAVMEAVADAYDEVIHL